MRFPFLEWQVVSLLLLKKLSQKELGPRMEVVRLLGV